jgi:hypothetical protein
MSEEKRRFSRIVFQIEAELTVPGKLYNLDEIANLSVGGCQLDIGEPLKEGTECSLLIILNPADRRVNVEVGGEVVRVKGNVAGIKFTSIEPEALLHLQNIIRYNASDPDRIEEEIDEHPGLI